MLTINLQNIVRPKSVFQVIKVVINVVSRLKLCSSISLTILHAIDQKKLTALVLLDMSKAFDCVNHNLLMLKLQDMGGSLSCLQWFRSYLSNRQQVVRINRIVSDALPLANGVPQGSILGPLLFNIYVNDLPATPQHCDPHCYVDDTGLLHSFKIQSKSFAIENVNDDLTKVRNWCFSNYLLLNPGKTKLLVFGSRQMSLFLGIIRKRNKSYRNGEGSWSDFGC